MYFAMVFQRRYMLLQLGDNTRIDNTRTGHLFDVMHLYFQSFETEINGFETLIQNL